MKPRRLVLDTNCVVSALIFAAGSLSWLRQSWTTGEIRPLVSRRTTQELLDVLGYRKFALTPEDREELLAEWLPHVEAVVVPEDVGDLPRLRDPDDLPFLALARHARADALVTGDGDLLAVASAFEVPILAPARLRDWLGRAR